MKGLTNIIVIIIIIIIITFIIQETGCYLFVLFVKRTILLPKDKLSDDNKARLMGD